jgi:His/Glu/Gln/Arg/opine family amino acid ABC transporter permease subunit
MTLEISLVGWFIAAALGILSGALRTLPILPLRWLAAGYVEFFRNVPLLVWMFFWYFGVPPFLPQALQDWLLDHGAEFWAGAFALGVYHGALPGSFARGSARFETQFEAAASTGFDSSASHRLVILPIAFRLIVPPATNETLNLLKNSSVALTIGVAELTFQVRQIETYSAKAFEALAAGTVIYLVLCLTISAVMARIERQTAIPGMITRGNTGVS